jgi:hypothetical protein
MIKVSLENSRLVLRFEYNRIDVEKARGMPDRRWNPNKKAWTGKASLANFEYIDATWGNVQWSDDALEKRATVIDKLAEREQVLALKDADLDYSVLDGEVFKKPPMEHQKKALLLGRDLDEFAYLMDQGTGKTKVTIDDACYNYRKSRIDVVMIFTINSVKTNWVIFNALKDEPEDQDALEDHMPPDIDYIKAVWVSQQSAAVKKEWKAFEKAITEQVTKRNKMVWMSANIESLRLARGYDFFEKVVKAFDGRVMICVDESTLIGKPGSKRTRAAMKLRKLCAKARILSGTPVIKSPMKAFSQFGFLNPDILGFGSFYSFRNRYCIMGGYEGRQILNYVNLDELQEKIASCSFRVLKKDCLDLPKQTFLKRRIDMTKIQAQAYKDMQQTFIVENEEAGHVEAKIVLEQMLRLQQITGGYLPKEGEQGEVVALMKPEDNPKFKEVLHLLSEGGDQRMLVWTRFTHEVLAMTELLNSSGIATLSFYGGLNDREKIAVRKMFQRDDKYRVVVGNPAAGGLGIDEFKVASLICYVTNSFDTEKRVQSEDRTHRIGSEIHAATGITYYDIVIPNTVDIKVLRTMRDNVKISTQVMKDDWKDWI